MDVGYPVPVCMFLLCQPPTACLWHVTSTHARFTRVWGGCGRTRSSRQKDRPPLSLRLSSQNAPESQRSESPQARLTSDLAEMQELEKHSFLNPILRNSGSNIQVMILGMACKFLLLFCYNNEAGVGKG